MIFNPYGGQHCLSGSLILCFKLPGKVSCYFRVLSKWDAESSGLSNALNLIDSVKCFEFNSSKLPLDSASPSNAICIGRGCRIKRSVKTFQFNWFCQNCLHGKRWMDGQVQCLDLLFFHPAFPLHKGWSYQIWSRLWPEAHILQFCPRRASVMFELREQRKAVQI